MLIFDGRFCRIRYNRRMNMDRINQAFLMASELHRDQIRKGSDVPYLSHLMGVAYFVLDNGGSENQAIAALLHDAVEDQGGESTLVKIRETFGEEVADFVLQLSDSVGDPKPPWRERKVNYLARMATASDEVIEILLADKVCNVMSVTRDYLRMGDELWLLFVGRKSGSMWYYREIYEVLSNRTDCFLLTLYKYYLDQLEMAIEAQN